MLGMLTSAVIPLAIIAFCAWHEEYVGRRRALALKALHVTSGSKLRVHDPDELIECRGCGRPVAVNAICQTAGCPAVRGWELFREQRRAAQDHRAWLQSNCSKSCGRAAPDACCDLGGIGAP